MSSLMQAKPYVHLLMDCRNPECGRPIPLPDPMTRNVPSSQSEWPKDKWKKFFVCVHCGQGYEYSRTSIRSETLATESPWALGHCSCYLVQYRCDAGNCTSPIEAFVVADNTLDIEKVHERITKPEKIPRVRFYCPNTHWQHFAAMPDPPKAIDLKPCDFPYF